MTTHYVSNPKELIETLANAENGDMIFYGYNKMSRSKLDKRKTQNT